jgi:hypothetical protein
MPEARHGQRCKTQTAQCNGIGQDLEACTKGWSRQLERPDATPGRVRRVSSYVKRVYRVVHAGSQRQLDRSVRL